MNEDVNPLKEDGSSKSPEEIAQERAARGLPPPAGSSTPPELLLKSLQEEREKRRELEDRLATLETSASGNASASEVETLKVQLTESNAKIDTLISDGVNKDVLIEYPILKEKAAEFETFLAAPENAGMSRKTAAKAFLAENGLLDARRPGLEKPAGGGTRTPQAPGTITSAQAKELRETNFKLYQEKLERGELKIVG